MLRFLVIVMGRRGGGFAHGALIRLVVIAGVVVGGIAAALLVREERCRRLGRGDFDAVAVEGPVVGLLDELADLLVAPGDDLRLPLDLANDAGVLDLDLCGLLAALVEILELGEQAIALVEELGPLSGLLFAEGDQVPKVPVDSAGRDRRRSTWDRRS